jgi:hypothetical protein
MGTSTNYKAPTSAQWSGLKGRVTRIARHGRPNKDDAQNIVRGYIEANGGPSRFATTGGSIGVQKAGQAVASNLGGFIRSVSSMGLRNTLDQIGVELAGKSVSEIVIGLLDYLGGPASTIDEVDARNALSDLREELFHDAQTLEDLERVLNERSSDAMLRDLLILFFGQYLYHQFCRVFYDRLMNRLGLGQTEAFLDGMKDYIQSTLRNHTIIRDIGTIDWNGAEGQQLAQEIFRETLEVFGG